MPAATLTNYQSSCKMVTNKGALLTMSNKQDTKIKPRPPFLPGDKSKEQILQEMIRVNHAGEAAALRIYQGQKKALGSQHGWLNIIDEMKNQEQEHLNFFETELAIRNFNKSKLIKLWETFGYVLGFVSAKIDEKTAMAVTVAVEEVIDEHYEKQLEELEEYDEQHLAENIEKFRQEEIEHRNTGLDYFAKQAPLKIIVEPVTKIGCHLAILIAKKL